MNTSQNYQKMSTYIFKKNKFIIKIPGYIKWKMLNSMVLDVGTKWRVTGVYKHTSKSAKKKKKTTKETKNSNTISATQVMFIKIVVKLDTR